MAIMEKIADTQKFLNVLTWRKLTQLVVFIFIIGLTWATYENRENIYGFASQKRLDPHAPSITKLSKETVNDIHSVVARSELIVGVRVYMADFQKNTRILIYQEMDDPKLEGIYMAYSNSSIAELPLFNDDVVNNKNLVALINGEFICIPFTETLLSKYAASATIYDKEVCSNGIPASYGRFTGIIAVHLNRKPTSEEVDQIRSTSRTLSTRIYDRDLSVEH